MEIFYPKIIDFLSSGLFFNATHFYVFFFFEKKLVFIRVNCERKSTKKKIKEERELILKINEQ